MLFVRVVAAVAVLALAAPALAGTIRVPKDHATIQAAVDAAAAGDVIAPWDGASFSPYPAVTGTSGSGSSKR